MMITFILSTFILCIGYCTLAILRLMALLLTPKLIPKDGCT